MSTMPVWKICRKCGKPYSYNPSVGEFGCPDCLKKKMQLLEKMKSVLGKSKENR